MNDLFTPLFDNALFFDWMTYQDLLACVYNNFLYTKLGLILVLVPLILLIFFYKVWDPIRKQRFMWFICIIIILIIGYFSTREILYSNTCILNLLGSYQPGDNNPDPKGFIFQMSMITSLYSLISSLIFTLIIKSFSTHNSHNPF